MTRRGTDRCDASASNPRFNSELATAQILADFQYKDSSRPHFQSCSDDCHTASLRSCSEECELPCSSECTDQCVVVCEEPHDLNDGLCCDLQNACNNSDCQYAYLDDSCCMGCPPDSPGLANPSRGSFYHNDRLDLGQFIDYQHPRINDSHFQAHDYDCFHSQMVGQDSHSFRSTCFPSPGFSHCTFPCTMNAANDYEATHIPSLVTSAGESPWSLQSSLSASSALQFSPVASPESNDPLSILANRSISDLSFLDPSTSFPGTPRCSHNHTIPDSLRGLSAVDLSISGISGSNPKATNESSFWLSDGADIFPKTEEEYGSKNLPSLPCRWLLSDEVEPRMCNCIFETREELHRHIIEDHVKTIKKCSQPIQINPVCRWQGCDSARRKKVFKLQHLKDHIVCHSKLRIKCNICGKDCRDSKVLKLHMNTHRPGLEKPFRCDVKGCTASFGTSALLSSHKRVHTGEKPHRCAWCSYRAADKGNLRRHEEEMHMGKKWPCPYCSQQLAKKANLTRHIRDLHANETREEVRNNTLQLFAAGE